MELTSQRTRVEGSARGFCFSDGVKVLTWIRAAFGKVERKKKVEVKFRTLLYLVLKRQPGLELIMERWKQMLKKKKK